MSGMKHLLITLIEKGDYQTLEQMGASSVWVDEARVVSMKKQMQMRKRGKYETQKKRDSAARELFTGT